MFMEFGSKLDNGIDKFVSKTATGIKNGIRGIKSLGAAVQMMPSMVNVEYVYRSHIESAQEKNEIE